jgi:transposase, IS5 family
MRVAQQNQRRFDCRPINEIELNTNCRHRIIPLLRSLQHLHSQPQVLDEILAMIAKDVLGDADPDLGREGMTYWQIVVLAAAKAGCNYTYDELQNLAEKHSDLKDMLQVGEWTTVSFHWERIRDNLCLLRPETLEAINHVIVGEGHRLEPAAVEAVRGDSFVCETNIHYPTESSLIVDGLKKIVKLAPQLAALIGFAGWRQSKSLFRKAKRANRELSRLKKNAGYQQRLEDGYQKLFHITDLLLPRLQDLLDAALDRLPTDDGTSAIGNVAELCHQLTYWHATTEHVVNTAWRRVMEGEKDVPNRDKLFSLFEPDTELIKRGKAAKPIEFGHKLLVIEDAVGYICHYQVLDREQEDRDALIGAMKALQSRSGNRIQRASFDRGFHSEKNQQELAKLLAHPCLPKPGSVQSVEQDKEATVEFRRSRQRHPGIESAIHALQSGNGLGRCRDHSSLGYRRYVGLGILGRNLLVMGKRLLAMEAPDSEAAASKRQAA